MPTGTPTEQDGFCWQGGWVGMRAGGKPKDKKSGGLRSQREFARGLCERECAQGDHGPPGLAGAPGAGPSP